MSIYFKCAWPEDDVPKGEPTWMFYEVDAARDVVTCLVELYENEDAFRDSIELAAREGPDHRSPEQRSLVHGPFLEMARGVMSQITADEFAALWARAMDKTWP